MEEFKKLYNTLNSDQQHATDTIDGAVMVLAKAGSGKTQVIGMRIANMLLSEQQIDPGNILCLTFTEAGVAAMRDRLLHIIGTAAYKVNIYTFHGFCNYVIQMNGDYFGLDNYSPAEEIDIITIIRTLIDHIPADNPLSRVRGDVYYEVGRMKNLFNIMKEENWDVDMIRVAAEEYLSDLPNREEFIYKKNGKDYKKGDVKRKLINAEKEKMDKLVAAAHLFSNYNALLASTGLYDFPDMIHMVIRALKDNETILNIIREKYQYILVDEFQDTNGSQAELIHLIMKYHSRPNVFVVGDDSQCIYAFQGAQIRNILRFSKLYNPETIIMNKNYRSNQAILDAGENVISNNTLRLTAQYPSIDKRLQAMRKVETIDPKVLEFDTVMEEEFGVAVAIKRLIDEGENPSDIAVLYRKHRQVDGLMSVLTGMDIPVVSKRRPNILDEIPIIQLLHTLEYICLAAERGDVRSDLLFKTLSYRAYGIPHDVIHTVWAKNKFPIAGIVNTEDFHIARATNPRLDKVMTVIDDMVVNFWEIPMYKKLTMLLYDLGVMKYWKQQPEGRYYLLCINTFMEYVKGCIDKFYSSKINEYGFIELINKMNEEGIPIPLLAPTFDSDGVIMSTVHGAKGLEWKHVFVIGAQRSEWEKSRGTGLNNYTFPDTLTLSSAADSDLEDSRRLFYVAVTRAKDTLTISYAKQKDTGEPLERTQFIDESGLTPTPKATAKNRINKFLNDRIKNESEKPTIPKITREVMDTFLLEYRLSPSDLNIYIDCPTKFYYRKILGINEPATPATIIGNAVHAGLKAAFESKVWQDAQIVANEYILRDGLLIRDSDAGRVVEAIRMMLKAYESPFDTAINSVEHFICEKPIRNIMFGSVPVKGNIDRIDRHMDSVIIYDYKTGSIVNVKSEVKPPDEGNIFGGKMWRQAMFYKQLIEQDQFKTWNVLDVIFQHIGTDVVTNFEIGGIDSSGYFMGIVNDVYNKIMNMSFDNCGDKDCMWCNLNKVV